MGQVDQSHGQGAGSPLDVCVRREVCSIGVRGNGAVAIGAQQSHAVLLEALDTLSEGCPNRFASPTETAAMRGATAAIKSFVEDVLLPGCAAFRKSAASGACSSASVSSVCSSMSPVSRACAWPSVSRRTSDASFGVAPPGSVAGGQSTLA
jgi:hypothetical protein